MTLTNVNVTFLALLQEVVYHCLPLNLLRVHTLENVAQDTELARVTSNRFFVVNIFLPSWEFNPVPVAKQASVLTTTLLGPSKSNFQIDFNLTYYKYNYIFFSIKILAIYFNSECFLAYFDIVTLSNDGNITFKVALRSTVYIIWISQHGPFMVELVIWKKIQTILNF